jgi:hypothetical protein
MNLHLTLIAGLWHVLDDDAEDHCAYSAEAKGRGVCGYAKAADAVLRLDQLEVAADERAHGAYGEPWGDPDTGLFDARRGISG